jgi:hypothetical protein
MANLMIPDPTLVGSIAVGIDTHSDVNVAAANNQIGRELGHARESRGVVGFRVHREVCHRRDSWCIPSGITK